MKTYDIINFPYHGNDSYYDKNSYVVDLTRENFL